MTLLTGTVALRCYISHHPNARINYITYNGRSVWMTQKQYGIWRTVLDYKMRGKWTTLSTIAAKAQKYVYGQTISVATVSRFLRRLDLWRFIDLVTLSGRRGGTVILTRRAKTRDREAWLAGAKITYLARKRARDLLYRKIRNLWNDRFPPRDPVSYYGGVQLPMPFSSTGAKYLGTEG